MSVDLKYISLNGVGLEPLDAPPSENQLHGGYLFSANTRLSKDRRVMADRRAELRFETNRRSGHRRAIRAWENGKNL